MHAYIITMLCKLLLCLITVLLPASCLRLKTEEPVEGPRAVKAVLSVEAEIPDEISGFGYLSYIRKYDIKAPLEAVVSILPCREGAVIGKNDLVAQLENPLVRFAAERAMNAVSGAQAALELAESRLVQGRFNIEARILELEKIEAELDQARREFDEEQRKFSHQLSLYEAGGLSEEAFRSASFSMDSYAQRIVFMEQDLAIKQIGLRDKDIEAVFGICPENRTERISLLLALNTAGLKAELSAAHAALDAAQKELAAARSSEAELQVRSPASALVGARYAEAGERVKRDDPLLTLIDTSSLYAVFPVRESDARRIVPGMEASVQVDAAETSFTGTVDLVSPSADTQSFTFSVRVLLGPDDVGLYKDSVKPGMFARVRILTGNPKRMTLVPESALLEQKDKTASVYIVSNSRILRRQLELGSVYPAGREVLAGIKPGTVLIDRPDRSLREGDHVQILP